MTVYALAVLVAAGLVAAYVAIAAAVLGFAWLIAVLLMGSDDEPYEYQPFYSITQED